MINKILYALLFAFVKLFAAIPMRALYVLSDLLYVIIYYLARYRRKVVRVNMQKSFPEKTQKELRHLERRFYRHFADYILESLKLAGFSQEELLKRANIRNPELIYDLQDKGHTCFIIMLGHYGNWEWFSGVSARFGGRGIIYQIYRPLDSQLFDRLFRYLRTRYNSVGIRKNDAVREMIRLKQNKILALVPFVADQSPSKANIHYWTQFLNQDSAIYTGAERIARKLNIPVIYSDMQKIRRGYYTVDFKLITDCPKMTAEFWITEQYTRQLEISIMRDPAFWLWTHKRWKHQRETV